MAILDNARNWQPFKIDALGIVTLLGANTLQKALGRLVINPLTEYLPLLAPQIIAEDTIAEPIPGFALFNVTDGIKATDLSAWWVRWLLCQNLSWTSTIFYINLRTTPWKATTMKTIGMLFSGLLITSLVALTVILGDWYGFACTFSILIVILARSNILNLNREAVDVCAQKARRMDQNVKLIVTLPGGKLVTIHTTRGIAIQCLLTEARTVHHWQHKIWRGLTWIAFAVFIITLGMTCLMMQLLLITCTVFPSVLLVQQFGCDEYHIGRFLEIQRTDFSGPEFRARTYATLNLTEVEEETMVRWQFIPSRTNTRWWERFKASKTRFQTDKSAFDNWDQQLA